MPANSVIQLRRGTAAQWTSANPVLANGEPGYETDTGKEKRGDGTTAWTSLAYIGAGSFAPLTVGGHGVVRTGDLVFNVKDFGAVGNGSTNDYTAIAATFTACHSAGGGTVYFPRGTYIVAGNLGFYVTYSNVRVAGAGPEATIIRFTGSPSTALFSFTGGLDFTTATATLTADANLAAVTSAATTFTQLTVGSTTGLAAGQAYVLGDTRAPYSFRSTTYAGEIVRVKSVDSSTQVTLMAAFRDSYLTSRTAALWVLSPVIGCGVQDLAIENANQNSTSTRGIYTFAVQDFYVSNVTERNLDEAGVELNHALNATVHRLRCYDFTSDDVNSRYGYGVDIGPSDGVVVSDCHFRAVRHGVTTSGKAGQYGTPFNARILGCVAVGCLAACFDSHWHGSNILFADCQVTGGNSYGFQIRSPRTTVQDCEITNTMNIGIVCGAPTAKDVTIKNNKLRHILGRGIAVYNPDADGNADTITVIGNDVAGTLGEGVWFSGSHARVQILENRLMDMGSFGGAAAVIAGIRVAPSSTPSGLVIARNKIGNTTTSTTVIDGQTPGWCDPGIALPSGLTGAVVVDNETYNCRSAAIFSSATGTTNVVARNRRLDIARVLTKSGSYTMNGYEDIILTNGATVTITLPAAASWPYAQFTVKNINSASSTVAGTIDGATNLTLTQYQKATVVSDGTNWYTV